MKSYYRRIFPLLLFSVLFACILFPASAAASGDDKPRLYRFPAGESVQQAPDYPLPELSPEERKLDAQLLQLVKPELIPEGQSLNNAIEVLEKTGVLFTKNINGNEEYLVNVYVEINDDSGFKMLDPVVSDITNTSQEYHLAVAKVEVNKLLDLAALGGVKSVSFVTPPVCRAGAAESEGDELLRADLARAASGADGTGVKIGIISDGATHYASSVASGDLPAGVGILRVGSGDEGTAMMELVHDLAPGAQLFFHDCGSNVLEFNAAIDALVAAGCTIVCDDIGWITEPFFEDGVVASHVKDLIAQGNVLYVSSAGNAAYSHYQGIYRNDGTNRHDFSGGTSSTYKDLYVHLEAGHPIRIVLEWNDAFDHSSNNYDLYLGSTNRSSVYATSITVQSGSQDPLEYIAIVPSSTRDAAVWVTANGSPLPKTLEVYIYGDGYSDNYINNVTQPDSIFGHPAVPGAVACGAIDANSADGADYNAIEYFSSQGPVTLVDGSTRQKPELCGADGTRVTGAGGFPGTFYGTSAAAPHVAAVAALLWSEFPFAAPAQIRQVLMESSVDYGGPGYDSTYGNGRIDALNAVQGARTVTFDSQGGSVVASVLTLANRAISEPADPTKSGCSFSGWYREPECVTKWNFSTDVVTEDITLYARWNPGPFTVTFDSQGGSAVDSQIIEFGGLVSPPAVPTWQNYRFGGWYREPQCVTRWEFETVTVKKDLTLYAQWVYFEGAGTQESPYLIRTAGDLTRLAQAVNAGETGYAASSYLLTGALSLASVGNWAPIGSTVDHGFTGDFDGGGYTIGGLGQALSASGEACGGLFGYVSGGSIHDVKLVNCSINVQTLTATGASSCYAGGIAGFVSDGGDIRNCQVSGTVSARENTQNGDAISYAGGIAGYAEDSGLYGCVNTGTVLSGDHSGGIASLASGTTIARCCNAGAVHASSQNGGIAGTVCDGSSIQDSYCTGDIIGTLNNGGIAGQAIDSALTNCYFIGSISTSNAGGIAVKNVNSSFAGCYYVDRPWKGCTSGADAGTVRISPDDLLSQGTFAGFDFGSVWTMAGDGIYPYPELQGMPYSLVIQQDTAHFAGGSGLPTDPYRIQTKEHLKNVSSYSSRYFILNNDIQFADSDFAPGGAFYNGGRGFMPISTFNGVFDGRGCAIRNLHESRPDYEMGLFGRLSCAIVENLYVLDGELRSSGSYYISAGGITASSSDSIIRNCAFSGTISCLMTGAPDWCDARCGGIAGASSSGTIENCYNLGTISGRTAGGIAGQGDMIVNCFNAGSVSGGAGMGVDPCAGGIVGIAWSSVSNCYNVGAVNSAAGYAGGIVGRGEGSFTTGGSYYLNNIGKGVGYKSSSYGKDLTVQKTDAQMREQSAFAGFDFDNIWTMAGSTTYPYPELVAAPQGCQVAFDSRGGSTVKAITAIVSALIPPPAPPTHSSYIFGGWYKESACLNVWDFASDVVTGDTTLYARWDSLTAPSPVAKSASYNSIRLTWEPVAIASGYEVYRAASATGGYSYVGTLTSTSFTNTNLVTGTTYYYKVRAYRSSGSAKIYSAYSAVASAKPIPAAPTSPKAAPASYSTIRVSWGAVAGATKYELYRSSGGAYAVVGSTTALSYANTPVNTGTTYYYKVRAYRLVGSTKVYGNYSSVVTAKTALAAPTSPKAAPASYNSIRVSWGAVAGATKYELYRSSGGSYAVVGSTTALSYTNTPVNTGTTYYYKVRAYRLVGSTKVYSAFSAVVSARTALGTPGSVKAAPLTYNRIKVTWGAVTGASGYLVYRATSSAGSYTPVGTATATSFTNTGTGTGIAYYYKVRAYRLVGGTKVYGPYSAAASAKTAIGAPATINAARASSSSIKVSWSAVSGATQYEVYRSTASQGTYALAATTASLYYTNGSLTAGRTYYYKVRACHLEDSRKVYGPFSKVAYARP